MPSGRRWTKEEDDFLKERVGNLSFSAIANRLDRTVDAIEVRVRRLGIDNTKLESGKLTANELARALNVDNHTVYRWINEHRLKAVRRVTRQSTKFNLISVDDFWKWAKKNKEKINFYKIAPLSLLPEPDWVEEERKKDYHSIPKRQAAKWTEYEDKRLLEMTKGGYTQKEIGKALGRSENSVQRRLSRLREWRKTPMVKVTLRWSKVELEMLLDLEKQGLSDEEIAYELGREADHIRDKRRCLRRKGEYSGMKTKVI